ncbi:MAG: thioredoxin [Candidatus Omnitrophota bacterium]|nr:thioredoxin [Candidatus Omnitrophota bacterium]
MEKPLILTDVNFKKEVLESKEPVLVDFWASWCPPCKMVEPMLEELSRQYGEKIKITRMNVDQNPASASIYQITGVPTFIIFKFSEIVGRRTGAQSMEQIEEMIREAVG